MSYRHLQPAYSVFKDENLRPVSLARNPVVTFVLRKQSPHTALIRPYCGGRIASGGMQRILFLAVSPRARLVRPRAFDAYRPSVEPSPTRLEEVFELWAPKSLSCEFGRRASFAGASARRLRFTRLELDFDRRGALPQSVSSEEGFPGAVQLFYGLGPFSMRLSATRF